MSLAFYLILGKPLIVWGGITTFILLILTALSSQLKIRQKLHLGPKTHQYLAYATITVAIMHAILGITAF